MLRKPEQGTGECTHHRAAQQRHTPKALHTQHGTSLPTQDSSPCGAMANTPTSPAASAETVADAAHNDWMPRQQYTVLHTMHAVVVGVA